MIDNSDTDFAILATSGSGIVGVIVVLIIAFYTCNNENDCSKKHCDKGVPKLMNHACLCVEEAH